MSYAKLVIGLTGGIGSGKSTVAALFAERGIAIIDTDQLARDLTQPEKEAFQSIIQQFGPEIILPTGQLDRKTLRKIVFADTNKRQWLENLLHPLIRKEMEHQIASALSPYCIAVIPLLLETKPNPIISRILVVDTTEELQMKRAQMRDQLSQTEIEAIIKTQVNREKRLAKANDVIHNDGNLEDLIPQVDQLHKLYLSLAK